MGIGWGHTNAVPTDADDPCSLYKNKFIHSSVRMHVELESIKKEGNIFIFKPLIDIKYRICLEADHKEFLEQYHHKHGKYPDYYVKFIKLHEKLCADIKAQLRKIPTFCQYFKKLEVIIALYYYFHTVMNELGMKPALAQKESIHTHTAPKSLPPIPVRYYRFLPLKITIGGLLTELGIRNQQVIDVLMLRIINGESINIPQKLNSECVAALKRMIEGQMPDEPKENIDEYIQEKESLFSSFWRN